MAIIPWEEVTAGKGFEDQPYEVKDRVAANYIEQMKKESPSFRYQSDDVQDQFKQQLLKPFAPKAPDTYSLENMQGAWESAKTGTYALLGWHPDVKNTIRDFNEKTAHNVINATPLGINVWAAEKAGLIEKGSIEKQYADFAETPVGAAVSAVSRVIARGIDQVTGINSFVSGSIPKPEQEEGNIWQNRAAAIETTASMGAKVVGMLSVFGAARKVFTGTLAAVEGSPVAINYLRTLGREAIVGAAAGAAMETLPAIGQSENVVDAGKKIVDAAKSMAIINTAFGPFGAIKNGFLRTAVGVPLLDLAQNGGQFTIDKFVDTVAKGASGEKIDLNELETHLSTVMNIFFLAKTKPIHEQIGKLIPMSNTDKLGKEQYDAQDKDGDVQGAIKTKIDVIAGLQDMLKNHPEQFDAFDKALSGEKEQVAVDLIKGKNTDLRNTLSAMFGEIGVKEKKLPPALETAPTEPVTLPAVEPLSKKEMGAAQKEAKEENMVRTALSDKPIPAADLSSWKGLERLADDYVAKSGAESAFYMNKALEAKNKHEAFIKALTIRITEMEKVNPETAQEVADVLVKNVTGNAVERIDGYINLIKSVPGASDYLKARVARLEGWYKNLAEMKWQQRVNDGEKPLEAMVADMADIENEIAKPENQKFKQSVDEAVKAAKMKGDEIPIVAEPDEILSTGAGDIGKVEAKVEPTLTAEVAPPIADQGVSAQPVDNRVVERKNTVESLTRNLGLMQEMLTIRKEVPGKDEVHQSLNQDEIDRLEKKIPEVQAQLEALKNSNVTPEVREAFAAAEPVVAEKPVAETPAEAAKFTPETAYQHTLPLIKAKAEAATTKEKNVIDKQIMGMKQELRVAMKLRDSRSLPNDVLEKQWKQIVDAERKAMSPPERMVKDAVKVLVDPEHADWEAIANQEEPTVEDLKEIETHPVADVTAPRPRMTEEQVQKAKDFIRNYSKNKLFGGAPGVDYLKALKDVAVYHIERGLDSVQEFVKKIVGEFGEMARGYAVKAWEQAKKEMKATPMFYSGLQKIVENKMGNSATVEQVRGMLKQVSSEEVKWSGVEEFLKGKDKVSKVELQKFLKENEVKVVDVTKGKRDTKFSQHTLPGGENYREVELIWPKGTFVGPHFPEKGIVVHVRLNDRVDAQGKKVLFVEEVQSDWGLKARKEGTSGTQEGAKRYFDIPDEKWNKLSEVDKNSYIEEMGSKGVPDAPFLKAPHELAMKRILRMAAEEGYDKVSWINGEETAKRYDLSKHLDNVNAEISPNGLYSISYQEKGKSGLSKIHGVSKESLQDYVGKDLAQKIIDDVSRESGKVTDKTYSGLDLKVGGEWAHNLYDKMIPQFMEKYGKKWGGKVDKTILQNINKGGKFQSISITPEMKADLLYKGQPLFTSPASAEPKVMSEAEYAKINDTLNKEFKEQVDAIVNPVKVKGEGKGEVKQGRIISDERLTEVDSKFNNTTLHMNPVALSGALIESAIGHMERTKSGTDFYNWANKIVKEVGDDRIRPYLHKAWLAAQEQRGIVVAIQKNSDDGLGSATTPAKVRRGQMIASERDMNLVKLTVVDLPEGNIFTLGGKFLNFPRACDIMQQLNPGTKWEEIKFKYNAAEKQKIVSQLINEERINAKLKEFGGDKASRNIGIFAISRQDGGKEFLKKVGISTPTLTRKEMEGYKWIRSQYEEWFSKTNEMMVKNGLKPIVYRAEYTTLWRVENYLRTHRKDPLSTTQEAYEDAIKNVDFRNVHPNETAFGFKKRMTELGNLDMDAFGILRRYSNASIKHLEFTPFASYINALYYPFAKGENIDAAKDPYGDATVNRKVKPVSLQLQTPRWARELMEMKDSLLGIQPVSIFDGMPLVKKGMSVLRNNLVMNLLSFSTRFVYTQAGSVVGTMGMIGGPHTALGIFKAMNPSEFKRAQDRSNALLPRNKQVDVAIKDLVDYAENKKFFYLGKAGEYYFKGKENVSEFGTKLGLLADNFMATSGWLGAEAHARRVLKLQDERSIMEYADDVIIKTQGSGLPGHIAPIQRTEEGRTGTTLQTFTINQWGNIIHDIAGIKNPTVSKAQAFKNVAWFILGWQAINFLFEDLMHVNSVMPTPLRTFGFSLAQGDNIGLAAVKGAGEMSQFVPVVGGLKYGSSIFGAVGDTLISTGQVLSGNPSRSSALDLAGKFLGVPGGSQMKKSYRQMKNPEANLYDVFMGTYPKQRETMVMGILEEMDKPQKAQLDYLEQIEREWDNEQRKVGRGMEGKF